MNDRPYIKVEPNFLLNLIGLSGIVSNIILACVFYSLLPETIPSHFNFEGEVDGYGSKTFLLIPPVISIVVFIIILIVSKYPRYFNYVVEITDKNAEMQYGLLVKYLQVISLALIDIILFLQVIIFLQINGNNIMAYSLFIVGIIMAMLFAIIGVYIYRSIKMNSAFENQ